MLILVGDGFVIELATIAGLSRNFCSPAKEKENQKRDGRMKLSLLRAG
jgi:hypothetical protein